MKNQLVVAPERATAPTQRRLGGKLPEREAYPIRRTRFRWPVAVAALAVMFSSILLANWVTTDYGFIPVGLGLEATAGTLFAGIALAARDLIQDTLGRWAVVGMIAVGTVVSLLISAPEIALASAAAFGLAELFDFAVYSPIRDRSRFGGWGWALAVLASNLVGMLTDTIVFLGIAFGPEAILPALPGQMVGKFWATLAYLLIGALLALAWRQLRRRGTLGG